MHWGMISSRFAPHSHYASAVGTIPTTQLDQAKFDHRPQRTLVEGVVASLGELSPGTSAFPHGIIDLLKFIPLPSIYEVGFSKVCHRGDPSLLHPSVDSLKPHMTSRGSFPAPPISGQLEAPRAFSACFYDCTVRCQQTVQKHAN